MSFSFASLFSFAKTVITDVAAGASEIAPVASLIPGGAAVDAALAGAASVANEAVTAGQSLVSALTPEVAQLEALYDSLFHVTVTPGAVVLTPKVSAATVSTTPAATQAATAAAS
jgi:hypothetical protein